MVDLTIRSRDGRALFTHDELACRKTKTGILAPGFAEALLELRLTCARPMIVTSCCRSAEHNRAVGGHPRSMHVYDRPYHPTGGACAIDIAMTDGTFAHQLIKTASALGWSIGINFDRHFIHLDRRTDFGIAPAPLVFSY